MGGQASSVIATVVPIPSGAHTTQRPILEPGKQLSIEVPAVEVPAVEVPAVDVPAVEVPAVEVPAVEVPAVEVPAAEVPADEVPAVGGLFTEASYPEGLKYPAVLEDAPPFGPDIFIP